MYRLVTGQPERLNVYTLAALCDLLECEVGELLEPVAERRQQKKQAAGAGEKPAQKRVREGLRPTMQKRAQRGYGTLIAVDRGIEQGK